jgi:hypothetical protein
VVVKWLAELVNLLALLGGAGPTGLDSSDASTERKRRRTFEEWQKKHGSKWDKR